MCPSNGFVFDWEEDKDIPCRKCNKGGKKYGTRGSIPNPKLAQARKTEMKELEGLIQCEDCGTKTHKAESD